MAGRVSASRVTVSALIVAVVVIGSVLAYTFLGKTGPSSASSNPPGSNPPPGGNPPPTGPSCRGTAACLSGSVTHIVDGDTLDVAGVRIRLTLVNSPDFGEPGYVEAKEFTNRTCPVGSQALVDEDDGQTGGSYGRMIALVYCDGVNLNAELLRSGNAVLFRDFCAVSEFAGDKWTGCP